MINKLLKTLSKSLLPGIIIAFLAVWLFVFILEDGKTKFVTIELNKALIKAEMVDTEISLTKGLGGRTALDDDSGMWFVFLKESKTGIWMRDMKMPIDIIWFDKNLKIVGIKERALPESYPEIFYPQENSRYVLETNADFIQKHGIKIGDTAKISKVNF